MLIRLIGLMAAILVILFLAFSISSSALDGINGPENGNSKSFGEFINRLVELFENQPFKTIFWATALFVFRIIGKAFQLIKPWFDNKPKPDSELRSKEKRTENERKIRKRRAIRAEIFGAGLDLILVGIGLLTAWIIKGEKESFSIIMIMTAFLIFCLVSLVVSYARSKYESQNNLSLLWGKQAICAIYLPNFLGVTFFVFSLLVFVVG